ncbi:MAG: DUF6165 family protein [Candidatus Puniceispirillales bacterium]|jgi:hypothetical protein|tara:strand:- start:309 stop:695 length:387 start_codon:yes stop_codon:yes gene_type:complete
MLIKIPVSTGELVDKITILEIKKIKVDDKLKLADIEKEHKYLKDILVKKIKLDPYLKSKITALKKINLKLWDIEDGKRKAERNKKFGKSFILLARNVYIYNDKRAQIKLIINKLTNSKIVEVKSYKSY